MILSIFFIAVLNNYSPAAATKIEINGTIRGRVIDETTQSPLPAVNVMIESTTMGAAADVNGHFRITNIPPGAYNLRFQMMGYETRIISNVVVNPQKTTYLTIDLKTTILKSEEISVTAGYFHEAKNAVTSNRSIDYEEIRSDPGSFEDVQRVVQALPAVVSGADQNNEIIVRGGMPGENLFVMDNIEIPNPNHFAQEGTSGGPINMLNTHFIRRVDFYAGAFPARYGDKASSVMDLSLREGHREEYAGQFYLGMAGAGVLVEGPMDRGRGSWIFSARKSYIDLIISSIGLTAVPHYYNFQGKAVYDLSSTHKLLINGVYGNDWIHLEDQDEGGYSRGAKNVKFKSQQYVFGATLQSQFGQFGLSNLTASQTMNYWDEYVYDEYEIKYFERTNTEIERTLKLDLTLLPGKRMELNSGLSAKLISIDYYTWSQADTLFFYDQNGRNTGRIFQTYNEWNVLEKENAVKLAAYLQAKYYLLQQLSLTTGLRLDYFHFTEKLAIDPRLGLSYEFMNRTSLNLAVARQSQSPFFLTLTANEKNHNLDYKYTQQVVLGLERLFREDLRGTVEVFYKDYRNVPIPISWTTPDPYDRSNGHYVTEGKGFAKGIEFFLQKKMTRNYFFTLSYAYSISKGYDPRFDEYYNWDYDYRHIFTLIYGIRVEFRKYDWYRRIAGKRWYPFLAWLLPFADQVDFNIRWRYLGGRPFTQPVYRPDLHEWFVEESLPFNGQRYIPYHRLDFRLDRRFMFKGWNIVTYLDLVNIYGRDNVWEYSYRDDGTIEKILQFQVFPVGGLQIEF